MCSAPFFRSLARSSHVPIWLLDIILDYYFEQTRRDIYNEAHESSQCGQVRQGFGKSEEDSNNLEFITGGEYLISLLCFTFPVLSFAGMNDIFPIGHNACVFGTIDIIVAVDGVKIENQSQGHVM